jgi:hypothetical protein
LIFKNIEKQHQATLKNNKANKCFRQTHHEQVVHIGLQTNLYIYMLNKSPGFSTRSANSSTT